MIASQSPEPYTLQIVSSKLSFPYAACLDLPICHFGYPGAKEELTIVVKCHEAHVSIFLDTGTVVSMILRSTLQKLKATRSRTLILEPADRSLCGVDGTVIPTYGRVHLAPSFSLISPHIEGTFLTDSLHYRVNF